MTAPSWYDKPVLFLQCLHRHFKCVFETVNIANDNKYLM